MSNILMLDAELVEKLQAEHMDIKAECDRLRVRVEELNAHFAGAASERDDLRGQVDRVTADAVGFSRQCTELRLEVNRLTEKVAELEKQLAFAKSVLEDCRPSIKARIAEMELSDHVYDTGPMEQLLGRIEAALESK